MGAAIGALVAIPVLLLVSDKDALKWIVIALASIGVAIQGLNHAYFTAVIASGALIAVDVTHPTNYGSEDAGCCLRSSAWRSGCS